MPYVWKKYISDFLSYDVLFIYNDVLCTGNLSFVITLIIKYILKDLKNNEAVFIKSEWSLYG